MTPQTYPNFLGIGAPKTASTWLYYNLRLHPDIWMPPIKELHYFDCANPRWNTTFLAPLWRKAFVGRFVRRLFRRKGTTTDPCLTSSWRDNTRRRSNKPLSYKLKCEFDTIRWDWNYLFSARNDHWYASLFKQGIGRLTGEITPSYAVLDTRVIQHIHEIMPKAMIIFVMRNPIYRAWSHARMMFHSVDARPPNSISDEEFMAYLGNKEMTYAGDYVSTLKNWGEFFPEKQFFIGFFEEIVESAHGFFNRLCRFLQVAEATEPMSSCMPDRILVGPCLRMPQRIGLFLAEMYYDQIKELEKLFGGYTRLWLKVAEMFLMTKDRVGN